MNIWYDDNGGWSPQGMQPIAGGMSPGAYVAAIASSPTHIDVFTTDPTGQVQDVWLDTYVDHGNWNRPLAVRGLRTTAGSPVTVAGQGPAHMDVAVVDQHGQVFDAWYDADVGGWNNAYSVGTIQFVPGALLHLVSRHRGRLDLFVESPQGKVSWAFWDAVTSPGWSAFVPAVQP